MSIQGNRTHTIHVNSICAQDFLYPSERITGMLSVFVQGHSGAKIVGGTKVSGYAGHHVGPNVKTLGFE